MKTKINIVVDLSSIDKIDTIRSNSSWIKLPVVCVLKDKRRTNEEGSH